jgi:tetratricopeptide (TPR) repeat protein
LNRLVVVIVLAVVACGLLAAGAAVAYLRWSAGLVENALETARQAEAAGDDEVAADEYQKYVNYAGPKADPAVLADRSLLLLRLASVPGASPKEVGRAFDATEVAIRQRPDDMRLRRRLAELKLSTGDYNQAREHLLVVRDAIERGTADDDRAAIDVQIARTWNGTGDHRQALEIVAAQTGFDVKARSFPTATSKNPPRADAYLLLSEIVRDKLGDKPVAESVIERCMQAHPDDPAVLVPYAAMMLLRNEPAAGLRAASRAAALAPSDPGSLLVNAWALSVTGESDAASTAFVEACRKFPDCSPLFASAARHVALRGTPEQVLEMLDTALERFPFQEYDVFVFLSNLRIDYKSQAEFVKRLEAAREERGSDDPAVVVLAARVLEATGRFSAAEKALVDARGLVPEEAKLSIDDALARCHTALGDWDEAIDDFQRLEQTWYGWERATAGIAEARFQLGQRNAAAELVDGVERSWLRQAEPGERFAIWHAPVVSTMIRVIGSEPAAKREWGGVERLIELLAASSESASDLRLDLLRAELLAAKGACDEALAALPADDPAKPAWQLDPLRISLIAQRDGVAAMREACAALPRWRRERAELLVVVARAEARHATGDDRGWLQSIAAATDRIASPGEAVQTLQALAGMANAAGWHDEARAAWSRAATRLPEDSRPPLALALDAARAGDADAGAKAAAQEVALEGKNSARGRVAAAAAIVAAVRAEIGGGLTVAPATLSGVQRKQLDDARKLLVEARNERKRWQPVEALSADIELMNGKVGAAVGHLQRARAYGPEDSRLTRLLADTLNRFGRRTDADRLRETIAPAGLGGGDRLVIDSLLSLNDFPAAADRAIAVIDVEAADVATLIWLGRLCARAGMQERAGELLTRVTRDDSSNPDAWIWLARWQVSQGAKETAEETIAAGIEAVPEAQRSLLAARGAAVAGRTEEAERRFREAAQESGGDIAPAAYTVDFLIEQNRGKEAEAFLREIIDGLGADRRDVKAWATQRLADLRDVSWK